MFRRLNRVTGAVRWETNVRGPAAKYFFHGDAFLAPDRIVASADVDGATGLEAGVHAFDRESGRQLWMHPSGRGVIGAVIGTDTQAFAYAANGDLIALDLATGKRLWSHALKAPAWESPAVVADRVFGGSTDGAVVALQRSTGHVDWRRPLSAAVSTSIRARGPELFAGTSDGMFHRLSAETGEPRSSLKLDSTLRPSTAPLVQSDAVLVLLVDQGADYRALLSLDPELRRIKWRRDAPDRWSTTRIFATSKTVVLGTPSGHVEANCTATGLPAWSHKLANAPIRAIGGSDEVLYLGTPQGTLFAVRPPTACD
jgi:outer membrane protein assembly factor BamB